MTAVRLVHPSAFILHPFAECVSPAERGAVRPWCDRRARRTGRVAYRSCTAACGPPPRRLEPAARPSRPWTGFLTWPSERRRGRWPSPSEIARASRSAFSLAFSSFCRAATASVMARWLAKSAATQATPAITATAARPAIIRRSRCAARCCCSSRSCWASANCRACSSSRCRAASLACRSASVSALLVSRKPMAVSKSPPYCSAHSALGASCSRKQSAICKIGIAKQSGFAVAPEPGRVQQPPEDPRRLRLVFHPHPQPLPAAHQALVRQVEHRPVGPVRPPSRASET